MQTVLQSSRVWWTHITDRMYRLGCVIREDIKDSKIRGQVCYVQWGNAVCTVEWIEWRQLWASRILGCWWNARGCSPLLPSAPPHRSPGHTPWWRVSRGRDSVVTRWRGLCLSRATSRRPPSGVCGNIRTLGASKGPRAPRSRARSSNAVGGNCRRVRASICLSRYTSQGICIGCDGGMQIVGGGICLSRRGTRTDWHCVIGGNKLQGIGRRRRLQRDTCEEICVPTCDIAPQAHLRRHRPVARIRWDPDRWVVWRWFALQEALPAPRWAQSPHRPRRRPAGSICRCRSILGTLGDIFNTQNLLKQMQGISGEFEIILPKGNFLRVNMGKPCWAQISLSNICSGLNNIEVSSFSENLGIFNILKGQKWCNRKFLLIEYLKIPFKTIENYLWETQEFTEFFLY